MTYSNARTATAHTTRQPYIVIVHPFIPPPLVTDAGVVIPASPELAMSKRGWIADGGGFTAYGDTIEEAVDNHGARS